MLVGYFPTASSRFLMVQHLDELVDNETMDSTPGWSKHGNIYTSTSSKTMRYTRANDGFCEQQQQYLTAINARKLVHITNKRKYTY